MKKVLDVIAYILAALFVINLVFDLPDKSSKEPIIHTKPKVTITTKASTTTSNSHTATQILTTITTENEESKASSTSTTVNITTTKAKSNSKQSKIVYITDTGTKYHKGSCGSLSKSKHEINRSEAVSKGYEPCARCKP